MPGSRQTPKPTSSHKVASQGKALYARAPGEELWLRRRLAGLTGPQAAKALGIGRTALWEAEARGKGARQLLGLAKLLWGKPPGLPDLLALARRRQGWGLLGTAGRCKISHTTLLAAERRGDAWLAEFWSRRGFTFVRRQG
jgi:hypothetical protein